MIKKPSKRGKNENNSNNKIANIVRNYVIQERNKTISKM